MNINKDHNGHFQSEASDDVISFCLRSQYVQYFRSTLYVCLANQHRLIWKGATTLTWVLRFFLNHVVKHGDSKETTYYN